MSGRKARSLPQLIRAYGIDRALDLIAKGSRAGGLQKSLQEAYPAATPGVIRQLIDAARQAREAGRAKPATLAQLQAQQGKSPVNRYQPKRYQYYTRVTVKLGGSGQDETWNVRIDSSKQIGRDIVSQLVTQKVEEFRQKALGESRERIRNSLTVDSVDIIALTKNR